MNTSSTPHDVLPKSRSRPGRRTRSVGIGATIAILVCGVGLFVKTREEPPPLPDAANVLSIEASFHHRVKGSKVEFEVPRAHWNAIYSALLPAHRDRNPAKWVGLGRLNFKLANGDSYFASLYSLHKTPGAFAAGPTFEKRVYYRGGNSSDLEQALVEAFEASDGDR